NAQAKSDAYTVLGLDVVWTAEFAANQWVVALPEDKFPLDDLIPATVVTGTYFDKLYGVPFTTNAELLFSRTDLLEQAGLDGPPALWRPPSGSSSATMASRTPTPLSRSPATRSSVTASTRRSSRRTRSPTRRRSPARRTRPAASPSCRTGRTCGLSARPRTAPR